VGSAIVAVTYSRAEALASSIEDAALRATMLVAPLRV
jgi:hypothetical protein